MYIKDPVRGPCQSCVDYGNTKKLSMETPKQLSMY